MESLPKFSNTSPVFCMFVCVRETPSDFANFSLHWQSFQSWAKFHSLANLCTLATRSFWPLLKNKRGI